MHVNRKTLLRGATGIDDQNLYIIIIMMRASLSARRLCPRSFSSSLARPIPLTRPLNMATATPRFAEGEDPHQLGQDTEALLQGGWALDADAIGLTKTFYFKSYFKAVVRDRDCLLADLEQRRR